MRVIVRCNRVACRMRVVITAQNTRDYRIECQAKDLQFTDLNINSISVLNLCKILKCYYVIQEHGMRIKM